MCIYKFKKEAGITIKSKETSSKLASYPAMKYWLPILQAALAILFVSVHTNLQDLIPTVAA